MMLLILQAYLYIRMMINLIICWHLDMIAQFVYILIELFYLKNINYINSNHNFLKLFHSKFFYI
jgi:hypothetical protein